MSRLPERHQKRSRLTSCKAVGSCFGILDASERSNLEDQNVPSPSLCSDSIGRRVMRWAACFDHGLEPDQIIVQLLLRLLAPAEPISAGARAFERLSSRRPIVALRVVSSRSTGLGGRALVPMPLRVPPSAGHLAPRQSVSLRPSASLPGLPSLCPGLPAGACAPMPRPFWEEEALPLRAAPSITRLRSPAWWIALRAYPRAHGVSPRERILQLG